MIAQQIDLKRHHERARARLHHAAVGAARPGARSTPSSRGALEHALPGYGTHRGQTARAYFDDGSIMGQAGVGPARLFAKFQELASGIDRFFVWIPAGEDPWDHAAAWAAQVA